MVSVSVCQLSEAVVWCLSVCVSCQRPWHGICQCVSVVRGCGVVSVSVCQLSSVVEQRVSADGGPVSADDAKD